MPNDLFDLEHVASCLDTKEIIDTYLAVKSSQRPMDDQRDEIKTIEKSHEKETKLCTNSIYITDIEAQKGKIQNLE